MPASAAPAQAEPAHPPLIAVPCHTVAVDFFAVWPGTIIGPSHSRIA